MNKYPALFFLITSILIGCKQEVKIITPGIRVVELENDFKKWWRYYNDEIMLSSDFLSLNQYSEQIEKGEFLELLTSGDFVPIKVNSIDNKEYYRLYKLTTQADKSIRETISFRAEYAHRNYLKEGVAFADFEFIDLDGDSYTSVNTLGKTLVIKLWFIGCTACVAEFPELNELVENNNDNQTVYLSLALDNSEDLRQFLERKHFAYNVIASQKEFIYNTLEVSEFPTHIVVDNKGIVRKVVDSSEELIHYLNNAPINL